MNHTSTPITLTIDQSTYLLDLLSKDLTNAMTTPEGELLHLSTLRKIRTANLTAAARAAAR